MHLQAMIFAGRKERLRYEFSPATKGRAEQARPGGPTTPRNPARVSGTSFGSDGMNQGSRPCRALSCWLHCARRIARIPQMVYAANRPEPESQTVTGEMLDCLRNQGWRAF